MPPVKPRSWLFDLFGDYVEQRRRELWTGSIIALAADFDLTERAIRSALLRLERDRWIAVRRAGARSYYRLTGAGRELIDRGRERILRGPDHAWDGHWAVVAYTIPEVQREIRDRLRSELTWLGFGALGSGLFVSPHDQRAELAALALRLGLAPSAMTLFRAERVWPGSDRDLADRCWDLEGLNARYRDFIEAFQPPRDGGLADRDCFAIRFRLINGYRRFPFLDPGLPAELLPKDWLGFRAAAMFQELHARLAPGANRYFDKITLPSGARPQNGSQATSQR